MSFTEWKLFLGAVLLISLVSSSARSEEEVEKPQFKPNDTWRLCLDVPLVRYDLDHAETGTGSRTLSKFRPGYKSPKPVMVGPDMIPEPVAMEFGMGLGYAIRDRILVGGLIRGTGDKSISEGDTTTFYSLGFRASVELISKYGRRVRPYLYLAAGFQRNYIEWVESDRYEIWHQVDMMGVLSVGGGAHIFPLSWLSIDLFMMSSHEFGQGTSTDKSTDYGQAFEDEQFVMRFNLYAALGLSIWL